MSQLGIDLFTRDHPPQSMGYLSNSKYAHIHGNGLDGEPAAHVNLQTVHCSTSFKLYCPKQGSKTGLGAFRNLVAVEAGKVVDGADRLMNNTIASGSPPLSWQVSLAFKSTPEFHKKLNYTVNNEATYAHWIQTMKDLNADHIQAGLHVDMVDLVAIAKQARIAVDIKTHVLTQMAAQNAAVGSSSSAASNPVSASDFKGIDVIMNQIYAKHPPNVKYLAKWPLKEVEGVNYHSPPSALHFEKLSAYKKRKLSQFIEEARPQPNLPSSPAEALDASSVVAPDEALMSQYIDFIKIKPSKKANVLSILKEKDITHPKMFQSANITREDMVGWGLSPGIISQLRDNTKKFDRRAQ
ncbi:hypothetical protein PTTG_25899 [Puccinia triticina 1-1 BBBD Race 1]|uniref:Uncharacterized protein n=1 Tax=Puccinia triticina (isolate 1-1 / race 1 (BBBD)) TaxID=630390 RepID=A0A180GYQ5_PUCT1|nr:hypothetical protein PTTG_25899 [Puccinia triticina 1-1 BBBD Race 1]